jgi:hypothetical protein
MPADGWPIVGWLADAGGLYVAVTHGGVTLAAHLAQLISAELTGGPVAAELGPYRPNRFTTATLGSGPNRRAHGPYGIQLTASGRARAGPGPSKRARTSPHKSAMRDARLTGRSRHGVVRIDIRATYAIRPWTLITDGALTT